MVYSPANYTADRRFSSVTRGCPLLTGADRFPPDVETAAARFVIRQEASLFDEIFPILTTTDLPRALGFYRDLLGATVTYQFPAQGEPGYVALDLGRSHLGIGQQDQPGDLANDRVTLWVYTDDCDTAVDKLRDAGVPVLQKPADQPWGERMTTVTDPDSNRVIVASRGPTS